LPGALKAIDTPGPEQVHYAFWLERSPRVLFCPDLIMRVANGELSRRSITRIPRPPERALQRLLDLPFDVLFMDRGAPITANPRAALRKLLG
jgi:hypothetical protein